MESKKCSVCGEVKPLNKFPKHKACKDGYEARCKTCRNEYKRNYTKTEKGQQYSKQYYSNNKEQFKQYHEDNKERIQEYQKEYYAKEENQQKRKAYRQREDVKKKHQEDNNKRNQTEEVRKQRREYGKEYSQRDEVKQKRREYAKQRYKQRSWKQQIGKHAQRQLKTEAFTAIKAVYDKLDNPSIHHVLPTSMFSKETPLEVINDVRNIVAIEFDLNQKIHTKVITEWFNSEYFEMAKQYIVKDMKLTSIDKIIK